MVVRDETDESTIRITEGLAIPVAELHYRFSRASGPGGQHVNRSETRVELLFDVMRSPSLTEEQRARILARLAGYIDDDGVLHLVSSATRSQLENRLDVTERLRGLLAAALKQDRRRIPTRPGRAVRQTRLDAKRARSQIKRLRRQVPHEE